MHMRTCFTYSVERLFRSKSVVGTYRRCPVSTDLSLRAAFNGHFYSYSKLWAPFIQSYHRLNTIAISISGGAGGTFANGAWALAVRVTSYDAKEGSAGPQEGLGFKTWSAEATAPVLHVVQIKGSVWEQVDVDVFSAKAGAQITEAGAGGDGFPTYVGADTSISLVKAQASIFDLKLGLGVETVIGFKDGSADIHALGCGVTLGARVADSVAGNEFAIDFNGLLKL
ncbi:hypothetical protein FRC04_002894 [Tulasnella sp. 424]|nr:hypothetical protein FRC04_002894 [Tulasnella sp. 424]